MDGWLLLDVLLSILAKTISERPIAASPSQVPAVKKGRRSLLGRSGRSKNMAVFYLSDVALSNWYLSSRFDIRDS
ncbi:hypothetical protein, partial [Candidatus Villigracilis saccharophilus]|uniref:hypothetical protein n=1 Tax=Candidatus Villigracilis saccharophilus TaxID=3140684 RepID=UPI0031F16A36